MIYSEEDYVRFYNDHTKKENAKHGWVAVLTLLVLVLGFALMGCDSEAAELTAKAEQEAHERKLQVLTMPCTWVAQCGNPISACPVEKRQCVNATLEAK